MKLRIRLLALVCIMSINFGITTVFATTAPQQFQLYPALNLWGYAADAYIGSLQLSLPIYADSNQVLFTLIESKADYDKDGWLIGAGAGYRKIVNSRIYSMYALISNNKSPLQHNFLIANPGIESLGETVDLRSNFYIPMSQKRSASKTYFADALEMYQYITPTHNQVFDEKLKTYEEIGPGVDAEVAINLVPTHNIKAHLGGYHFHLTETGNITGGEAKVVWQVKPQLTFELQNSYDNYRHNTTQLGIHISIGGALPNDQNQYGIATRLLDPVEHNYATFGDGYGVPIRRHLSPLGKSLEYDNVWFFKSINHANIQGHGTAEDPYLGIDQATFNHIVVLSQEHPATYLWFATGVYDLSSFNTSPTGLDGRITLPDNFHLWGREIGYQYPAQKNDRPVFCGGIDLMGNNADLDSIALQQNALFRQPYAILIGSGENYISGIQINNVNVGSSTADVVTNFPIGIKISNAAATIKNSGITAIADNATDCIGILATQSKLNLENSGIAVDAINNPKINLNNITQISGLYLTQGTTLNLKNVSIGVNAETPNANTITGIFAAEGSYLKMTNLHLGVNAVFAEGSINNTIAGIYATKGSMLDITDSSIGLNSIANEFNVSGIFAQQGAYINASNLNIGIHALATASNSNIAAINASEGVFLKLRGVNAAVNAETPNAKVYGIYASDGVAIDALNLNLTINSKHAAGTYGIYTSGYILNANNFKIITTNFNINAINSSGDIWGIYAANGFADPNYAHDLAYSWKYFNTFSGDAKDHRISGFDLQTQDLVGASFTTLLTTPIYPDANKMARLLWN